jgi:nickel transport system permease protein
MNVPNFLKRGLPVVASILILLIFTAAIGAPWISPYDPTEVVLAQKFAGLSQEHLLGCDHLGRDVLSRLLHGARISVGSTAIILSLVLFLGFLVGITAGYFGGGIDSVLMRLCDVFLTFPTFILAMFMISILGTGMTNVILAVSLTHWAWYARIIRGLMLTLKNREYVLAARVAGTGPFGLLRHHILPTVTAQLIILSTLDIGHMMLHVSGLSFLGLGVTPPMAEWGVMISDARQYVWSRPELIFLPGCMIFLTVMAFNLVGDAFRDALDPALKKELSL